jgi:hypothetical protein
MDYLYIMETNVMPRLKIGVSNNPNRRRREIERTIQAQHGIDKFVKVLWTKEIENAYDVELQAHFYLKPYQDIFYKTNGSTEWFNTSLKKVYSTIGSALRWYKLKPAPLPNGMIRDNLTGRIIKKQYLTKDQIEKIEDNNNVNI